MQPRLRGPLACPLICKSTLFPSVVFKQHGSPVSGVCDLAVVVKTVLVPFGGWCTTHCSLFLWGLGYSLGVRDFDPWPFSFLEFPFHQP